MLIRKYNKSQDESELLKMIEAEEGWEYNNKDQVDRYTKALETGITYVAYNHTELCGYSRSFDDAGLHVFVLDLLVKPSQRGQGIGQKLMEVIHKDYPNREVFVLSDVDVYYEKLGYKNEGSIFNVNKPQ